MLTYNIGTATSLPWSGREGRADYDRRDLIQDTERALGAETSAIVHMETLRRAALYARSDRPLLSSLLARLVERATVAERSGTSDPLAYLDAGYMIEAVRQLDILNDMAFVRVASVSTLAGANDGYVWIAKALKVRPDDGALHLAAALIAADRHRDQALDHSRAARLHAGDDVLLARNLNHLEH